MAAPAGVSSGTETAAARPGDAGKNDAGADAATDGMSFVVVDLATGKVLSQHHASERRYPASTTKLMTAYLALEALRDRTKALDSPVVVTRRAAAEPPSKMGFKPGSVIRLDMALRMMLVKSANDIAYAIGQSLGGGSIEAFSDKMNAAAARLGMKDSHFINPNGLPGDGQYSSAKDLALLASAIRTEFPAFADYFGTEAISTGGRIMKNGNKLLGQFDGADGMKTGYICASGFNLVSSATRNGRTLIAVVMGANGTIPRERLSANILHDGFETDPSTVEPTLSSLPVSSGKPLDVSDYICAAAGRTDRANERVEESERDEKYGSPYLHDMGRSPSVFRVSLGGAAAGAGAPAGVSMIESYGIPIPTPRPLLPAEPGSEEIASRAAGDIPGEAGKPGSMAATVSAFQATGDDGSAGKAIEAPLSALRMPATSADLAEQNRQIRNVLSQWARKANGDAATADDRATAARAAR